MRTFTLLGLLAAVLQGVTATGRGWRDQAEFSCPQNIKNDCTADESNGFDWSDLNEGSFKTYRGYNFNGWNCANKLGKRNLEGRTFNNKCIETDLSSDTFSNEISCDKSFSIGQLDISVDQESDVEFHFGMPDGSTCKQTKRCGVEGTTVTNDQCGGAQTVKVKLPTNSESKTCKLGVHKVQFECGTTTTSVPVPTTTIPTMTSSTPVATTSSSNICTVPSDCTGAACTMPAGCTTTTGDVQLTSTASAAASTTTSSTETCTIQSDCTGATCTMPAGCTGTITGTVKATSATSSIVSTTTASTDTCTIPNDCTGDSCTMPVGCTSSTGDIVLTSTTSAQTPITTSPTETCTIPSDCTGSTCTMPAGCPPTTGDVNLTSTSSFLYTNTTSTGGVKATSITSSALSTITAPTDTCTISSDCTGDSCTMPAGCPSTTIDDVQSTATPDATTSSIDTCTIPSDCTGSTCTMPAGCTPTTTGAVQLTTSAASSTVTTSADTCTIPSGCTGAACTMPAGCGSITSPVATGSMPSTTLITNSAIKSIIKESSTIVSTVTSVIAGSSSIGQTGLVGSTSIESASSIGSTGSSTIAAVFTTTSSAAVPDVTMPSTECPDVLPRCLKTWIFITNCTDTADPTCFCPQENFVNKVVDCLSSWGTDDSEIANSVEYFLGLCQSFIPQNPAIVTAIPPSITLPSPSADIPVQTIVRTITTVVPCEPTTITTGSSSGSVVTLTTSSVTKTVTIPQVTLVVTATDATLVYPTKEIDATATTPAPTGGVATSISVTTTAPAVPPTTAPSVLTTSAPTVQTAVVTYPAVFGTKTTLVTYPVVPSANATGNVTLPSPSSVALFTGAASSIVPATFISILGAAIAVLFQL